ncbi:hypothetical protein [Thermomonospora umbrina]|uniref:Uncharacterized protein n=1 Tax=Thermomonospora umbrina TaxID=111806 RepID=A0A3D9SQL9_9ACTN|nr:hypothetical protein [Thermomonospora umbrina]REE96790.1 hypothetical protein DFJ69_2239 [Thermomonospora umbrina]
METDVSLQLELLSTLSGALSEHGLRSRVRDDVNGLAVETDTPDVYLWVFVSFTGRFFTWNRGSHQHPIRDIPGAARRINTHVQGFHVLGGDEQ